MIKDVSPALQMSSYTQASGGHTVASSSGLPAHEYPQFLRVHLLLASYLSLLPDTANNKKGRTSTACGCSAVLQGAGAEDVMGVGAKPELGVCTVSTLSC